MCADVLPCITTNFESKNQTCSKPLGAKTDCGDGLQQTPLFYCVHWEWWELVELLIEYGCDLNSSDVHGKTALHCAAECSDVRPLKLLVE